MKWKQSDLFSSGIIAKHILALPPALEELVPAGHPVQITMR